MNTRRKFVSGAIVVGLATLATGRATAQTEPSEVNGSTDWPTFLGETRAEALRLIREDRMDTAAYVHLIASRILSRRDLPSIQVGRVPWADPAIEFGAGEPGAPFVIVEFRLAPDAYLPPHSHPNNSVATIMLDGQAIVDNFELEDGSAPAGFTGEARLRHTGRELMRPRDTNVILPTRNNLHAFHAGPHGARGIDLTSQHGASERFGYLKLLAPPNVGTVIAAQWANPAAERLRPT